MQFISNDKLANEIIALGAKSLDENKKLLERIYLHSEADPNLSDIELFFTQVTDLIEEIISTTDLKKISVNYERIKELGKNFYQKNKEFLNEDFNSELDNILLVILSTGIIIAGIRTIQKSRQISNDLDSIKLVDDGVDKISIAVENYLDYIPKKMLLLAKKILTDILKNTIENDKYVETFERDDKILLLNNVVAIKRTCNSSLSLIDFYLAQDKDKQEIIDLYPNPETFDFIKKQEIDFDRINKELLKKYQGKFVYFENGQILDSDLNENRLIERVLEKVGYRSIFITQVAL